MKKEKFFLNFVFFSFVLHIALFIYMAIDPLSGVFSRKDIQIKNAVRVDTIGLPELQKKIQSATAKPTPAPPQKKPKKKPAVKIPKKKVKPPAKKKIVKPPAPVKKPKTVKREQEQAMEKIKQMQNLEQEQAQAIDKVETLESLEQIKKEVEEPKKYTGAEISKGIAGEGERVKDVDFQTLKYFTSVRAHINMYWNLPQELANKNLRAEIYTVINNKGRLLKGEIIKSSGNEDFDARVLETLQRADPLPPPPTREVEKLLSKGVVFKFPE